MNIKNTTIIIIFIVIVVGLGIYSFFALDNNHLNETNLTTNNTTNNITNNTTNNTTNEFVAIKNNNQGSNNLASSSKHPASSSKPKYSSHSSYSDWQKDYKTEKYDEDGNPIYRSVASTSGGQNPPGIYESYWSANGPISNKRIG